MRPWQDILQRTVTELFREWSQIATLGAGFAREFAHAALHATLMARDAVLEGRAEDLDAYIATWLQQKPTSWRREAVATVLLDDGWIPADPDSADPAILRRIKQLTRREASNHKWLAETQLRGHPVQMLDRTVAASPGGQLITLGETIAVPQTRDGLSIRGVFDDQRLTLLVNKLKPAEQLVLFTFSQGCFETWESAALTVGQPSGFGESLRRKCKRLATELARRAASATDRAAGLGLATTRERRVNEMARNTGRGSRRGSDPPQPDPGAPGRLDQAGHHHRSVPRLQSRPRPVQGRTPGAVVRPGGERATSGMTASPRRYDPIVALLTLGALTATVVALLRYPPSVRP